ncbi:hypothetical protein DAPPUDRAFT_336585 [Daphnia pulex]|uniref:Uncharacterized protein n=1 Tax=Daphnia pulex TaxID=6669 RepID=E9HZY9_DAPPU|nr:hypothetical protein DAPPUDRAFT_336585 [Daphnia pulex]|eukprot:EFX62692.1 hypothetical protein DAPPUDRAFT_336585 [Daphnia pulex]
MKMLVAFVAIAAAADGHDYFPSYKTTRRIQILLRLNYSIPAYRKQCLNLITRLVVTILSNTLFSVYTYVDEWP